MVIAAILTLALGLVTAFLATVYCFKSDMIVRQVNQTEGRTRKLLHFALPIRWRESRITARQVRSTGLGLFLLSAFFLIVAITSILGHH
jgi:predicted lysophospholipase L1 biosynthesis ABC-type transport system permease subunit